MKAKKIGKIILRILLVILILFVVFVIGVFVFHQVKRNEEINLLKEKGNYNPVSVGDYNINVAKFGNPNGKHTIVAMSGMGVGNYSVAVRRATAEVEKDNLVVFPDRAGYGLSDDSNQPRTIENIIEEYRTALKNAGIAPPYILLPHSISGPYANYWSSKYPDEIEGIVIFDGTPLDGELFYDMPYHEVDFDDKCMAFLCKMGFARLALRQNTLWIADGYSEEEENLSDSLTLMTYEKVSVISEEGHVAENCKKAYESMVTNDIPKVYICADSGYTTKKEIWENYERIIKNNPDMPPRPTSEDDKIISILFDACQEKNQKIIYPYAEKMGNCKVELLGGEHQIYQQRPNECAKILKDFVDGLDK